jgi:hypothetical protein
VRSSCHRCRHTSRIVTGDRSMFPVSLFLSTTCHAEASRKGGSTINNQLPAPLRPNLHVLSVVALSLLSTLNSQPSTVLGSTPFDFHLSGFLFLSTTCHAEASRKGGSTINFPAPLL